MDFLPAGVRYLSKSCRRRTSCLAAEIVQGFGRPIEEARPGTGPSSESLQRRKPRLGDGVPWREFLSFFGFEADSTSR